MELTLVNVTKEFEQDREKFAAVDGVTYTMHHGVYGLLGVNGAGKTTLMRMLCTLLRPTKGQILLDGKDIFSMDGEYRRLLGYLPQEFGYYPEFSVKDYLLYIASIKGIRPAAAKKRVRDLLRQVGMEKAAAKKMKKLSGGMKRRVGIAQAMLNNPKILILDEPTAGLDPNERIRFRNLISELAAERLVLLSTHIVSDIEYIANEILLMKDGKVLHSGTAYEVIAAVPTRVWKVQVSGAEAERYMCRYQVVNIKNAADYTELRILSPQAPTPMAQEDTLTLEDAFLYYFETREEGEEYRDGKV